mmetsp:Transcript_28657/g.80694  ORF Transcript_28657/g.80694 Transcript_28657/m.80694 type:complete len:185 (+) Transcript_28657:126-680(+)
MPPVYNGSCLCGHTAFQVDGSPIFRVVCHCSLCTKWYGSTATALAGFPDGAISLSSGKEDLLSWKTSDGMERMRCGKCGSPVYNQSLLEDYKFQDVALASLACDDSGAIIGLDALSPVQHIFYNKHNPLSQFSDDNRQKWATFPGAGEPINVSRSLMSRPWVWALAACLISLPFAKVLKDRRTI